MLINGCQEGKGTPRLVELKCPKCGEYVEAFVIMGGAIGKTGTVAANEICLCGYVLPEGSYESDYKK